MNVLYALVSTVALATAVFCAFSGYWLSFGCLALAALVLMWIHVTEEDDG